MRLFFWLKELIFPRKCLLCQGILSREQSDLCHACRCETPQWNISRALPDLDDWTALWYYEGPVRDSLHRYKFGRKRHYAKGYGRLLAMQTLRVLPNPDLITWVPVSRKRKRKRGYDQSELLTKALSAELSLPAEATLKKIRHNPAQSGITDSFLRQQNVKDAYRAIPGKDLTGKRILLVDDILTTGATGRECTRVLRRHGAKEVYLAVIAAGKEKNIPPERHACHRRSHISLK